MPGDGMQMTEFGLGAEDRANGVPVQGDGRRRTDFRGGDSDQANAVALQSDGNIIAAGIGRAPNQTDSFALARYLGG